MQNKLNDIIIIFGQFIKCRVIKFYMNTFKHTLRIFLSVLMICLSYNSHAQVKLGLKAGANYMNLHMIDKEGYIIETYYKPGYQAGLYANIPLSKRISFQPSLLYSKKGYKEDRTIALNSYQYIRVSYVVAPAHIEAPMHFVYKTNKKIHPLIGMGPYISYGIGGKWKGLAPAGYESYVKPKGTIQFVEDYANKDTASTVLSNIRKIDAGISGFIGVGMGRHFSVQLGGQFGLLNVEPFTSGLRPAKSVKTNYGTSLSVAYTF